MIYSIILCCGKGVKDLLMLFQLYHGNSSLIHDPGGNKKGTRLGNMPFPRGLNPAPNPQLIPPSMLYHNDQSIIEKKPEPW